MNYTNRRGFTIVELVIVIAVIAILAAVLIPTFGNVIENAQNSAAMQEALGAYTEYIIDYADEGVIPEYLFYKNENKVVVLKNGAALSVHETEEEAIKEVLDNPETSEDESAGYTLDTLKIDGLYFMQSDEETECNHSYVSVVTAPTCVKDGYTTHTCSLCSDSYTDSETPATNEHSYIDGKCECGAEEPNVFTIKIGRTSNSEWLFDLAPTGEKGVYEGIVRSNDNTTEALFYYNTSQLVNNAIPESGKSKGILLKPAGGIEEGGTLEDYRANNEKNINLKPGHDHVLTIDFNTNTWSLTVIPKD
jgi:prepilin-type N-terminal cleavage/methylation domain-containing protein